MTARIRKKEEAEHDVHQAHDAFVHQTAEIAGNEAQGGADAYGNAHGHKAPPTVKRGRRRAGG